MIRSPLQTALFHPVNLAMLAMIAAAGLCSAWWLAPIGLVFWLIMVWVIVRNPALQLNFSRQNRLPLSMRFQARFERLDRARISVYNAMRRYNSPPLQRAVEPIQSALDEMVDHAYQLSLRFSALDNNFVLQRLSNNLPDEIAKMQKNIESASDDTSRSEYNVALQSLISRQNQIKEVGTLLERFEAQITGANSAVDSVVTNVVSFQGRSPKLVAEKIPALLQLIQNEQDKLIQFDTDIEKSQAV